MGPAIMKKALCALCVPALMLGLSACDTGEKNWKIADLEEENAALRAQIEELEKSNLEENPIDPFFDMVEYGGTTSVMNTVAGCQADAWEAEARHLAEELKLLLPLQEDRDLVDAYIAAAAEQVSRMGVMAIYPVSDVSLPESERIYTSGTLRGVLWAGSRAQIWKDTFYQLRSVMFFEYEYEFVFDAGTTQRYLTDKLG